MEKQRQKELLKTWECPKYKKSSQQLPSYVIAMRDSLFRKMFSPLSRFKQEKTLRNFSKTVTLYKYDNENKEEAETKSNVCD